MDCLPSECVRIIATFLSDRDRLQYSHASSFLHQHVGFTERHAIIILTQYPDVFPTDRHGYKFVKLEKEELCEVDVQPIFDGEYLKFVRMWFSCPFRFWQHERLILDLCENISALPQEEIIAPIIGMILRRSSLFNKIAVLRYSCFFQHIPLAVFLIERGVGDNEPAIIQQSVLSNTTQQNEIAGAQIILAAMKRGHRPLSWSVTWCDTMELNVILAILCKYVVKHGVRLNVMTHNVQQMLALVA